MTGKTALIAGATGLIGGHCLGFLLDSPRYQKVIALTRRPLAIEHPKLHFIRMYPLVPRPLSFFRVSGCIFAAP